MNEQSGTYRRPYHRGDFHLVDTATDGTYWQSPEGLSVRIASGEGAPVYARREARTWTSTAAMLFGRTARQ